MSWKKRPENVKSIKQSKRIPHHIGIVQEEIAKRKKEIENQKIREEKMKREEKKNERKRIQHQ